METIYSIIKNLILPPGILFVWMGIALVLLPRFYRLGVSLLVINLAFFYLLSSPFFSFRMISTLENAHAQLLEKDVQSTSAQAIVVLGGGRYRNAREFNGDTVSKLTLERLRYAAKLQKITGLKLFTSGGKKFRRDTAEGELMKITLHDAFNVDVAGVENESRTTWENAFYTKKMLEAEGITNVLLVTHAWHMPRALYSFKLAGINAIPAPTGFTHEGEARSGSNAFLPNYEGLSVSFYTTHEYFGMAWYKLKNMMRKDPKAEETKNTAAVNP